MDSCATCSSDPPGKPTTSMILVTVPLSKETLFFVSMDNDLISKSRILTIVESLVVTLEIINSWRALVFFISMDSTVLASNV